MKKISIVIGALICAIGLEANGLSNKEISGLNQDQSSYRSNKSGLVTAATAATWINDWTANHPANVDGRLFIMQVGLLPGDTPYIKHDNVNVFNFDRTAGCTTTGDVRFDGVSNIPMPIFDGGNAGMDGAFWAYDINPHEDMLLVVVASDNPKNMALAARFLWTMNYWGMKKDNISLMNGTAMYMFDPELNPSIKSAGVKAKSDMFVSMGSEVLMAPGGLLDFGDAEAGRMPTPRQNFQSITSLGTTPNFDLFASMEDMRNVVDADYAKNIIIDGRGAAEYNADIANKRSKSESKECGVNHDKQCYSAFEGHIQGAVNFEYRNVVNTADYVKDLNGDGKIDSKDSSMTFKSKSELADAFAGLGVEDDSDVYIYCRTGVRASLLTFASFEILGKNTHMYDGSWIQWSKLADATDTYSAQMLPADSPWRNDVARYTYNVTYNTSIDVGPASKKLDPYANIGGGNAIRTEDEAYLSIY